MEGDDAGAAEQRAEQQSDVQINFDDELPQPGLRAPPNAAASRNEETGGLWQSPSLGASKRPDSRRLDARRLRLRHADSREPLTEALPERFSKDDDEGLLMEVDEEMEPEVDEVEDEKRKKRRKKKTGVISLGVEEMLGKVEGLLLRMERAATDDMESNANRQPAIEKIKMLDEVEEACIHREMQRLLLNEGLLGVLKSWIEPLTDGTLPNIKIRTTVLRILQKLPIDTGNDADRANLKNSKIGSRVMFLSRIQDETAENKRMASELVQKWSRPIFEEARRYDEEERIQHALSARKRRMESERLEEEKRKSLNPGDPDFRYVASRPQPNRDYVIKPKSRVDAALIPGQKKSAVIQKINKFKRRGGKKGL